MGKAELVEAVFGLISKHLETDDIADHFRSTCSPEDLKWLIGNYEYLPWTCKENTSVDEDWVCSDDECETCPLIIKKNEIK